MADINFTKFPFKFPAVFWDFAVPGETKFPFTFPARFYGVDDVDPDDVDPAQISIFPFSFPATFYEEPV